jgi:hypothetical protein
MLFKRRFTTHEKSEMLIDEISVLPREQPNLDEVLRGFMQYFQANYGTVSLRLALFHIIEVRISQYTMGTGSLLGYSGRGVAFTTHPI